MEYLEQYLNYLEIQKNYSAHTVASYRRDIIQFFAITLVKCEQVNDLLIRQFISVLLNDGVSKRSINRKLSALKGYYNFLSVNGYCPNLFDDTDMLKSAPKLPNFLYPEEIDKILDVTPSSSSDFRNLAIFELLYSSGLRLSEIASTKLEDIDFEEGIIKVIGKGNKMRLVPVTQMALSRIKQYLPYRNQLLKDPSANLFLSLRGKSISTRAIEMIVSKMSFEAIGKRINPHAIRHSYATSLLDNDVDIRLLQELLGHSSLATTQLYTKVSTKKMTSTYKKAHPRAKRRTK